MDNPFTQVCGGLSLVLRSIVTPDAHFSAHLSSAGAGRGGAGSGESAFAQCVHCFYCIRSRLIC